MARQFRGGERFVDGVGGTGEQPGLLAGGDDHRAGTRQRGESRIPGVEAGQRGDQSRAARIGIVDGGSRARVAFAGARRVIVEPRDAREIGEKIGVQCAGRGQCGTRNADGTHRMNRNTDSFQKVTDSGALCAGECARRILQPDARSLHLLSLLRAEVHLLQFRLRGVSARAGAALLAALRRRCARTLGSGRPRRSIWAAALPASCPPRRWRALLA